MQRKATALNFFGTPAAKAHIGGASYRVQQVHALDESAAGSPGSIIDSREDGFVIAVADGAVMVTATPLTDQ